jgi:methionyl-tRNA synthetase
MTQYGVFCFFKKNDKIYKLNMEKKFYITTSIAYTNAPPHIGFAFELLQADVLARYYRQEGDDVFFLTGTDEHGLKIERAARKSGKSPIEFTNEISSKFQLLTKRLNISNDDFIRTTDKKKHWPTVNKVWKLLLKKGDIYKKNYKGFYCVGCEAFLKEKDLVNGKCPNHQKEPEIVEEENYFFCLSKYANQVKKEIEKNNIKIIPETRKKEILSFIKQGVEDISISRSKEKLSWGIPVPEDKDQTIYVWFDALLNYISALGYDKNSEKFKKYWPADVQCIGKDIFRFHALIWPAILIALDLPRPKNILVHGFITVEGQKMSKSLGNVVDPFKLIDKFGSDAVRYFLLREIPSTEDGDFSPKRFKERYNSDLAFGLGNLVSRVLKLANISNFKFSNYNQFSNKNFQKIINKTQNQYKKSLENFKFNESLASIWELISYCDKYIEKEKPWELLKDSKNQKANNVLSDLFIAIGKIADFLEPFLPAVSDEIKNQLKNKKQKPLFPRIL